MNYPSALRHSLSVAATVLSALILLSSPASATYPGQNGRIAFTAIATGTWQLYTMNPDGSDVFQVTNLVPSDNPFWFPDYSPDGQRIVFCHDMTGALELYLINVDGTGLTQLTNDGAENLFPRWSPDGRHIVFSQLFSPDFGYHHLVTMKADGTDRRQLTNRLWDDYQPEYTTNGKHIIFASNVGGLVSALWIVDTNGSNKRRLTAAPLEAGGADMAPDGKHMVFYSQQNTARPTSIWVANTDGTGLKRLTRPKQLVAGNPVYSPDGTRILFNGQSLSEGPVQHLFEMNPDGSGVTLVSECADGCPFPDWGAKP
jgi:Tol biopolymer transport system component